MKEAVEKVLRYLDEAPGYYRPTPKRVREIAKEVAPEEDPKALAKEVLRELRRRVRRALEAFWEALGIDTPPPPEVGKTLEEGKSVIARFPERPWEPVTLRVAGKSAMRFPSPLALRPVVVLSGSKGGDIAFHQSEHLHIFVAQAGWASLHGNRLEKVRETAEVVKGFRPLFRLFGLEDLEEALLALTGLEEGEVRTKGPYLLARRRGFWFLRRGSLLGDPLLDRALLTGDEEVVLSYPEGLKVGLKPIPLTSEAGLKGMWIQWGEEVLHYDGPVVLHKDLTERGFLGKLVRKGLRVWLGAPSRVLASAKMWALLQELSEREDPLEALEEPGFLRKVRLRALSRL
jgi:hypothetical protein